jgi:NTE family protein
MDITIALGGGGVRGVAHIGVLRALEKHGFNIKAIAGTSAGGLAGAVYAAGYSTEQIEHTFNEMEKNFVISPSRSKEPALLGMSWITKKISNLLGDMTFADLKIPFAATATNLRSGKEFILRRGKVMDAALATIAIPGAFPSQNIEGYVLADGGVVDPVPIQVARWMAPDLPVVAVMLNQTPKNYVIDEKKMPISFPGPASFLDRLADLKPVQAFNIFTRSAEVSGEQITELAIQLYQPEVVIAPKVGHINVLQQINSDELIQAGIDATEESMSALKSQANWARRLRRQMRHRLYPDPMPETWEILG